MWNALVSALLRRRLDRADRRQPAVPRPRRAVAARRARPARRSWASAPASSWPAARPGSSPAATSTCRALRQLGAAGSPAAARGLRWVYEQLGPDVLLNVGSGGTDVCTGIVQGGPLLPVWRGRDLRARASAVDARRLRRGRRRRSSASWASWSSPRRCRRCRWASGATTTAAATAPRTSSDYPGVWRHGDWIRFTERGSCVITGRSDATLNRGGVRLGTGEFYRVVEELAGGRRQPRRPPRGPGRRHRRAGAVRRRSRDGRELDDDAARARSRRRCAARCRRATCPTRSSRCRRSRATCTGKKLELPVKRILQRRAARRRRQPRRARRPGRARSPSSPTPASARRRAT